MNNLRGASDTAAPRKRKHGWGEGEEKGPAPMLTMTDADAARLDAALASLPGSKQIPPVLAVVIPETSPIVLHGYLCEAPCITYDKTFNNIFQDAGRILKCLLGDMQCEVIHDADWQQYPEVAKSLQPSGIKEDCFAVAICPPLCRWGLGIAGSWKNRESAARLSLAVAVALEAPHFEYAFSQYPAFHEVCVNTGIMEAIPLYRAPAGGVALALP